MFKHSGCVKALGLWLAVASFALGAPVASGETVEVELDARPATVKVAHGVKMRAWTFNGTLPGPVIRATEGDTVQVTLTNSHRASKSRCPKRRGPKRRQCQHHNQKSQGMAHSIDFHAAEIAPNVGFRSIAPGQTHTFSFEADLPGVYVYHCGTQPMLEHMGMGMYGMIVVDPALPRPPAREVFLVQSEIYGSVKKGWLKPSWDDMLRAQPRYVVFNGREMRYAMNPIQANAGEPVRIFFVDAGPSLSSAFHVVGTIFEAYEPDGNPDGAIHNVSTQLIAPGGGGIFELEFPEPGTYPFVSHSMVDMNRGAMGLFEAS